jgi:hypothetical protein
MKHYELAVLFPGDSRNERTAKEVVLHVGDTLTVQLDDGTVLYHHVATEDCVLHLVEMKEMALA